MINDYVKTGMPIMFDQTADQLLSNPTFEDWSGAPPNDQPDEWTCLNFANFTESADGLSITAGGFSCEQDVMTVGNTYLAITNIISYTSGTIQLRQGGGANIIDEYTSEGMQAIEFEAEDTEFVVMSPTAGAMTATIRFVYLIDITNGINLNRLCKEMRCCDADADVIHVLTDAYHFPPFQIKSDIEDALPGVVLYDADTDAPVDPQPAALTDLANDIDIYNDGEHTWYIYEASAPLGDAFAVGDYYLVFTLTEGLYSDIHYSQEVRVCGFTADIDESVSFTDCEEYNPTDYMRLEWWSDCDFDNIVYQYGFRNRLWLDAILDTPRPEITKDTNDNDSRYTANYMSLKNFYQLKVLVPEFMYDALIRLPLYGAEGSNGHVALTTPNGDCGELHEINITAEWQENSCLCYLTIEFLDEEYPVVMGNCCNDYDLSLTS